MIELKQLKDITLNKDNPRLFEQMEIDEIVKSLKKSPHMLWLKPIVLNSLSIVLAGNLRTTGAKAIFQLGTTERGKILKAFEENIQESDMSETDQKEAIKNAKTFLVDKLIPVVYANFLTKEQETEFLIKDNSHFGAWDIDALTDNFDLADILEWGVDESLWGEAKDFDDDEGQQSDNTKGTQTAEEDDYEMPEVEEIKTGIVVGDLFDIGQHRLLCGDSTDKKNVTFLLGMGSGSKFDLLTDPPYGININMNMGRLKGQPKKFEDKNWDKSVPDFFHLLDLFDIMIIWGGNYFADMLPVTKDWLCWSKKMKGLDFAEFELAWSNTNKNARILEHHWSGEKKLHPTMKPVPVMAWCLNYLKSEYIFDLFLGSGTTMVATHQLNRKCYGMELDPKYCQVILDHMRKLDPSLIIKKNGVVLEF